MAEQQMPPLTPMVVVSNPRATLDWFAKLGFENLGEMTAPDGTIVHAEVARGPGVRIMIGPAGMSGQTAGGGGISLYITLGESVDAYHDSVKAAGVTITEQLTDQFWGDRTFTVKDSDGYTIMFSQHIRDVSMEEMMDAMKQTAPA
jgi:uncharacterized glyoxalase superfamily protein PhnB